jgi:hypothetical protein
VSTPQLPHQPLANERQRYYCNTIGKKTRTPLFSLALSASFTSYLIGPKVVLDGQNDSVSRNIDTETAL